MQIVVLIPARKGSKRLPGKNILPYKGKPMVAHTITAAKEIFSNVIVSTDCDKTADIAREYGALVHNRPPHTADDESTVNDVCLNYLEEIDEGIIVCLYATAPERTTEDIKNTLALIGPNCDFAVGWGENKDNGSTYIAKIPQFKKEKFFFGPTLKRYKMPPQRSIDINTQADFDELCAAQ